MVARGRRKVGRRDAGPAGQAGRIGRGLAGIAASGDRQSG
jgi:hypothetical protein